MSEEREPKRRICGCGKDIEANRDPQAEYRVGHRQRNYRRQQMEMRERFWGQFGKKLRKRPAVRSAT